MILGGADAASAQGVMEEEPISTIPESVLSKIFSLTSPQDACRLATVCKTWRSAAGQDAVWERFLPANYREILSQAAAPVEYSSKKELFLHLADSILFKDGRKRLSLERSNGKVSIQISAEGVNLGDYHGDIWDWFHISELSLNKWHELGLEGELPSHFRFNRVGLLRFTTTLDIKGKNFRRWLTENTLYSARLIYRKTSDRFGLDVPIDSGVIQRNMDDRQKTCLDSAKHRKSYVRDDGWLEIEIGRFFNGIRRIDDEGEKRDGKDEDNEEHDPCCVYVLSTQGRERGGLLLEGIELSPAN